MTRHSMYYFKLYHDVFEDYKIRRFSVHEKFAWIALLCMASKSGQRGLIKETDEDIAGACEFNTTQDWLYFKDKLVGKGLVEFVTGGLLITNWEKCQSFQQSKPSDAPHAVRARVQKHREKKKKGGVTVTPCNADVTPQNTHIDPDLDPDPDSDKETPFKENEQAEKINASLSEPEEVSTESLTSLVLVQSDSRNEAESLHEGSCSAAPNLSSAVSRFESQFQKQELPIAKVGPGINDWDTEILDGIVRQWNAKFSNQAPRTRADAIAFICKSNQPSDPGYPALLARIQEVREENDRIRSRMQEAVALRQSAAELSTQVEPQQEPVIDRMAGFNKMAAIIRQAKLDREVEF